jgi:hypothetical protein
MANGNVKVTSLATKDATSLEMLPKHNAMSLKIARLSTRCECCLKPLCRKEQYGHGDDGLGGGVPVQEHHNLERRRRKKKGIGESDPPRIPLFTSP